VDGQVLLDQHGGMREDALRLVRIQGGQLVSEAQLIQLTKYTVRNHRAEPVRAYIRSLKTPGWTLKSPPAGTVETPEASIVPIDVPAGASAELEVLWQQPVTRTVAIDSSNATQLLQAYLSKGSAPPAVARVIEQLLGLQSQLAEHRREEARLHQQRSTLAGDADRVRENLNVLRRTRGNAALEAELAGKLATLERELGKLSGRLVQLSESSAEIEAKIAALIKDVSLEAKE
jgi:hypothetical protein